VNEHERVGPALHLRRQHLDIDLALHDLFAGFADIMAADIEEAALGDGRLVDRRHWKFYLREGRRAQQRRQQRRINDAREPCHDVLPDGFCMA
jgi:hypothetical protein